ncbi:Asp-tRNA(Asn)/Glu-tRNA(Gln) amidotransferase subunit GatA [candidate division KSB1 bacterium]|nr:Asp-tRNA(Asn)/Glu-tRNA(Gln) amidotransferase subunit GatA [candidate division KSB1 bacterium]
MKLIENSYGSVRNLLAERRINCVKIVDHYLREINKQNTLNSFITLLNDRALKRAELIDHQIRERGLKKLSGLVIAIKDNICVKDVRTTCASRILSNFISPYDATVIHKLESEDAIIIAKTNMDEFAMGSSNETSHFGTVKNPHDTTRVPGGSSGGSAVSVAANLSMAALGSDTGGSIRQPASFCGIVGLKPTYGRVSRFGLVAFASSLDQIGPLTTNVEDCARILEVIAGQDTNDSTCSDSPVPSYVEALQDNMQGLTIGLPIEYFSEHLETEIKTRIDHVIDFLKASGFSVVPISLPHTEYAIADYYIIATAEASSNLERYDGARYGYRSESVQSLDEMYVNSRRQAFGDEVKRRIMLGTYVLSSGYYDAYYRKAQKVRALIKSDFQNAFDRCDCILTPTSPTTAFKIGDKMSDPLDMYLSDIYTVPANLAGIPAISIPVGKDMNDLPIGLQIMGRSFDESTLLKLAFFIERNYSTRDIAR